VASRSARSASGRDDVLRRVPGLGRGRIESSVELRPTRAGGRVEVVAAKPGTDVVVIEITGGPALVLHPETARDLLLAQEGVTSARSARGAGPPDRVEVPFRLRWSGIDDTAASRGTRGALGDALVSAFHVVTDVFEGPAADFTASRIVERVDAQVADGVYALDAKSLPVLRDAKQPLDRLPANSVGGPVLVFLHGTFSSTQGTFQKLWVNHPGSVQTLFGFYADRVYALDHSTLGRSPIENAITLVEALLPGTRLHLVTHSRGGLVAEVLARVCGSRAIGPAEREHFGDRKYASQLAALERLTRIVADRRITVERVARVACPVRGTLLASKRLDAYVSVLKWGLELAGIPVAPAIVDFLGLVAQRRADPTIMPGLAAQIPDSPLVQWLNDSGVDIAGDLRVVAGDLAGDSVTSWLKTLLSDAFYWTDNDLVVQTRGMYGGSPRKGGATFLLDQGGGVSHFNYFSNDRTADAVVNALTQGVPTGFRKIGPLSWSGESSTGVRAAPNAGAGASASDLPAAIIVPDVLASHLRVGADRVWLSRRTGNELERLAYPGVRRTKVEADGVLEDGYKGLMQFLAKRHEVVAFAYDWRLPIELEAKRLAAVVRGALDARGRKAGEPVRIVAHGMGGLVARALQFVDGKTWDRLLAHDGGRILLLGVPNGGAWTPMQVLSGDETFGTMLLGLAAPMQERETRQLFAGFPGFMQLQAALTDTNLALGSSATWEALASTDVDRVRARSTWHSDPAQIAVYKWGIPAQRVLDEAVAFRAKLDAQAAELAVHVDKIVSVVGTTRSTPDGFTTDGGVFAYRNLIAGGDGYITAQNALLPGLRAWAVASEHRSLTTNPDAFDAYGELLETGTTRGLARVTAAGIRGAKGTETWERSRPSRRPTAPPPAELTDLLSTSLRDATLGAGAAGPALPVTVVNGNLKFVRDPIVLGHYRSMALSGTEWVMDEIIGGAMNQLVWLRQYPDGPRTNQIFVNTSVNRDNPFAVPRPEAVIVVGLGEEGKLSTTDLTASVTHGVIAWAQRLVEQSGVGSAQFDLAATLLGSGGVGISAGQSALAVAQGVREANLRLIDAGWPTVGHLSLIELYLDRATDAWRALQVQSASTAGQFRVTDTVKVGTGGLRRPLDSGYRGTDYDFITATTQRDAHGDAMIAYRLDTKRARTEVHASAMQGPLLRELVVTASNDRNTDAQIGRTLFQLLIPADMEPFLGGTTSMVLEVDPGSAGIPWELLDTGAGTRNGADARPWAIRSKLLRKLRLDDYRTQVADADADAHVLIIGEPACDAEKYPRLPAAQAEARAVLQEFVGGTEGGGDNDRVLPADRVKALISDDRGGADARTVMNTVLERDWRIIHIAGHGEPPERIGPAPVHAGDAPQRDGDPRGVVLSNGTFLGPREIDKMRVVPELVFVNCCHLAARNVGQLLEPSDSASYDRSAFAAGVAEALIRIGVRCVIAAGWAVDDEQAKVFATTFYDQVLNGRPFIDAVAEARLAAQALGGNTWAAYQCYGDPDWRFRWHTGDAQDADPAVEREVERGARDVKPAPPPARATPKVGVEFAGVASEASLVLALDTLAIGSRYDRLDPDTQRLKIKYLEDRFAGLWGNQGDVAEAFGRAWNEAGDQDAAIAWYQRAVDAADGSATMSAAEQLGNLRARVALTQLELAQDRLAKAHGKRGGAVRRQAVAQARGAVTKARTQLESLALQHRSAERLSLCGSAWKRQAMVERAAGDAKAEQHAIEQMKHWYDRAERAAVVSKTPAVFYPGLNRIAAELLIGARKKGWRGFDAKSLAAVRASLDEQIRDEPDFWSVVGKTELQLYQALAAGSVAAERATLERDLDDLHVRMDAPANWDSVLLQLELVLPRYAEGASRAEATAATGLLDHVRQLRDRQSDRSAAMNSQT
jgi:hypothetical protein